MLASLFTILLTLIIISTTVAAFKNSSLMEKMLFSPEHIMAQKEFHRLFSSAFIHLDAQHIIFNSITLLLFGQVLEQVVGPLLFLLIFFLSVLGGNLLSLFIHRHHNYRALGASGGTSGLIISYIILCPGSNIGSFILPGITLPGLLFGFIFFLGSIIAMHKGHDNVGHDAHIGGGITGLLLSIIIAPQSLRSYPMEIGAITALLLFYILYLIKSKGGILPFKLFLKELVKLPSQAEIPTKSRQGHHSERVRGCRYVNEPSDLDHMEDILRKISNSGIDSLTEKEKKILHSASKRLQDRKK